MILQELGITIFAFAKSKFLREQNMLVIVVHLLEKKQ